MKKVMTVYGTRPEGIKMAPVIRRLEEDPRFECISVVTGQHREMLDQVNEVLGITPTHDLDVFAPGQTLNEIMARIITLLDPILEVKRPDAVVVQGDTSTVAAAALASFNRHIPVVHLEAGLRSGDIAAPFPEEANRSIATRISSLHLAPTQQCRTNLEQEGIRGENIVVTGNTVIDALMRAVEAEVPIEDERLRRVVASGAPVLLVTAHRRENWGRPMERIGHAIAKLALSNPHLQVILPAHLNPIVPHCPPSPPATPAACLAAIAAVGPSAAAETIERGMRHAHAGMPFMELFHQQRLQLQRVPGHGIGHPQALCKHQQHEQIAFVPVRAAEGTPVGRMVELMQPFRERPEALTPLLHRRPCDRTSCA